MTNIHESVSQTFGNPEKPLAEPLVTEAQVIKLAFRLGDALARSNAPRFGSVHGDDVAIDFMTRNWVSQRGNDFREEETVVLMRDRWMKAAIGLGSAVFEGNISDGRAHEIEGVSGIRPVHVVAVGAHMDEATLELAKLFFQQHPESGFETDYYVGENGIVKISLVPVGMDERPGSLPDIESLGIRRRISEMTLNDLLIMNAVMQGFVADIKASTHVFP